MRFCQGQTALICEKPLIMPWKMHLFLLGLAALCLSALSTTKTKATPSLRYLDTGQETRLLADPDGITADTTFAIASVGKTMTAVAILRRVAQGTLRLDDPVSDWVNADITNGLGGLDDITLRHLLTMTSGLPDYYTDAYLQDVLEDPSLQSAEIALSYAFDEEVMFDPGSDFDYSNTNYVLLGMILEKATGLTYAQALQRDVFTPARMTNSFVFGSQTLPTSFATAPDTVRGYYEGAGFGDGGVISTGRDVAQFYRALFLDQTLLPSDLLADMTTDPIGKGYSMGIELDGDVVGHSGGDLGFSSDVRLHLSTGSIAVMLVAEEDADTVWTDDQMPD